MTGWLIFFGLALAAFGALRRFGRPARGGTELVLAAVLVAAAGYAWQGSPGLESSAPRPSTLATQGDDMFTAQRGKFGFASVGGDADVLASADTLFRQQLGAYAVAQLRAGLHAHPQSMELWTGLGNALVRRADGIVTPAARLAFDRAARADPKSPAPPYFLAMAYAQGGDLDSAEAIWRRMLGIAPADAPWLPLVINDLLVVKAMRQMR